MARIQEADEGSDGLLEAATARLRDAGIDATPTTATGSALDALAESAPAHDVIVMGESAQSLRSLVLGDEADRIASASVAPVIVVRDTPSRETDGERPET